MIKYVRGNLLDAPQPIIVHQVNCQGVMGSGVAKAIRDKYPQAYQAYRSMQESYTVKSSLLGQAQIVSTNEHAIINLFSQYLKVFFASQMEL